MNNFFKLSNHLDSFPLTSHYILLSLLTVACQAFRHAYAVYNNNGQVYHSRQSFLTNGFLNSDECREKQLLFINFWWLKCRLMQILSVAVAEAKPALVPDWEHCLWLTLMFPDDLLKHESCSRQQQKKGSVTTWRRHE